MITLVNIIYQSQKLRLSKQRIEISSTRKSGKIYSDLPKKSVDFVPVLW